MKKLVNVTKLGTALASLLLLAAPTILNNTASFFWVGEETCPNHLKSL